MYLVTVVLLLFVLPVGSIVIDHTHFHAAAPLMMLVGRWFVFWANGVRLFIAGLRQAFRPRFTSEGIFGIKGDDPLPFVEELGMANLSMGVLGLASAFVPSFVLPSAIVSGLYYGFAGIAHARRKTRNTNLNLAMVSDLAVFLVLAAYVAFAVQA